MIDVGHQRLRRATLLTLLGFAAAAVLVLVLIYGGRS